MSRGEAQVAASYRYCRAVARRARSSFVASFLLLPADKHRAMDALYAFLRHTDDLGDNQAPVAARAAALAQWRALLHRVIAGESIAADGQAGDPAIRAGVPLLPALADAQSRFQIPVELLEAAIDGQEMDLNRHRYATFAELETYCEKVASAVGLACIYVWGFSDKDALGFARTSGVAFQLTNILRDLKEDLSLGRVYLPAEDLAACGYTEQDLASGVVDERLRRLVRLEVDRARRLYDQSARLDDFLAPEGRRIFGMMSDTYRRLLELVDRRWDCLFARRLALSRWEKARILARWVLVPTRSRRP